MARKGAEEAARTGKQEHTQPPPSPVIAKPRPSSFVSRLSSPVFRLSSFVPRHCEAPKGLWQSAIPVQTPVSRPNVGNPMGAEPPWSSGRESRGDRLEIGPLWRFLFPVSFPLKETGSRRSAKSPRPVFVPAAAGDSPSVLRIRRSPVLFVPPVPSPPAGRFL